MKSQSSKKAKFFFSTAVQNWDVEYYVKVDDGIYPDLGKFIIILKCTFFCFSYQCCRFDVVIVIFFALRGID